MVTRYEVKFTDLTHVIINTGYAPPLADLLSIESVLRDKYENNLTCLFASNTVWHLGVMIPDPFGFKPHPFSLPESTEAEIYIKQVKSLINQMMSQRRQHPFYQQAMDALTRMSKMSDDMYQEQKDRPCLDLYENLFNETYEWSVEPLTPDRAFDYHAYKEGSDEEHERLYDAFGEYELIVDKSDQPVLSYNTRLAETQTIIDLLGGFPKANGCVCIKLPDHHNINPLNILDTIIENDLSYCASFGLDGFRYVTNGSMKILVLEYDAEHG